MQTPDRRSRQGRLFVVLLVLLLVCPGLRFLQGWDRRGGDTPEASAIPRGPVSGPRRWFWQTDAKRLLPRRESKLEIVVEI